VLPRVRSTAPSWVSPRQIRARVVGPDRLSISEHSTVLPEPSAIRRLELQVVGDQRLDIGSSSSASSTPRSSAICASVITSAAIAVAAGSRIRRTSRNSSTVSSRWNPQRTTWRPAAASAPGL